MQRAATVVTLVTEVEDLLACAKTRIAALSMASKGMKGEHGDVVGWLSEDCGHMIELATDALARLRVVEAKTNG